MAIGNNQSSVKSFRMCHRSHKSRVTKVQNTSQKLQVTGHTSCKPVQMGLISVTLLGVGEGEGRGGEGGESVGTFSPKKDWKWSLKSTCRLQIQRHHCKLLKVTSQRPQALKLKVECYESNASVTLGVINITEVVTDRQTDRWTLYLMWSRALSYVS